MTTLECTTLYLAVKHHGPLSSFDLATRCKLPKVKVRATLDRWYKEGEIMRQKMNGKRLYFVPRSVKKEAAP